MKIVFAFLFVWGACRPIHAGEISVNEIQSVIEESSKEGLNPRRYNNLDSGELQLRDEALKRFYEFLKNLNLGVVDPSELRPEVRLKKKAFISKEELPALFEKKNMSAREIVEMFSPQSPYYISLRDYLNREFQNCDQLSWPELPRVQKEISLGDRNQKIPAIKKRLRRFGYQLQGEEDLFDSSMLTAINDIQNVLKKKPDGVLSPKGKT